MIRTPRNPAPPPRHVGKCRFCGCTADRACEFKTPGLSEAMSRCSWIGRDEDVCSNPACLRAFVASYYPDGDAASDGGLQIFERAILARQLAVAEGHTRRTGEFAYAQQVRYSLAFDAPSMLAAIANIQLALRHPGNTGPGRVRAHQVAMAMINAVAGGDPAIAAPLLLAFEPDTADPAAAGPVPPV